MRVYMSSKNFNMKRPKGKIVSTREIFLKYPPKEYDPLYDEVKEFIKDENNPFEGIKVQFLYGTAYSNIYSTNAKESYTEDGYNYMVWDLDLENPDSVIPVLISHSPKVWVFEVIGISIGLLAVGIVLTIFIVKKKKRTIVEK